MQLRDLNRRLCWWLKRKKSWWAQKLYSGRRGEGFSCSPNSSSLADVKKSRFGFSQHRSRFRGWRALRRILSRRLFRSPNFPLLLSPCSHIVWLWILHFPLRHRSSSEKFTFLPRFLVFFSSPSTITRRFSPNEDGFSSAFMAALETRLNRLLIDSWWKFFFYGFKNKIWFIENF